MKYRRYKVNVIFIHGMLAGSAVQMHHGVGHEGDVHPHPCCLACAVTSFYYMYRCAD